MWVQRGSLASPKTILGAVEMARKGGFNTLIVQVRGRGDAFYESRYEPRSHVLARQPPSFDPLELMVTTAHRAGLKVHAWVNVNLVSDAQPPAARRHLVYTHPEWLMVPRALAADLARMNPKSPAYLRRLSEYAREHSDRVEGIFLSPVHKGAVGHTIRVIGDIAARYDLDGIHLDYIRFPSDEFDYSTAVLNEFRSAVTASATPEERRDYASRARGRALFYTEMFPQRWQEFRRARLTALLTGIRATVKERASAWRCSRPPCFPTPTRRRTGAFRTGVAGSSPVCSMPFARWPIRRIRALFRSQIANVEHLAGDRPVWAGIGAYQLPAAAAVENILAARQLGAEGIVLFSYDNLDAAYVDDGRPRRVRAVTDFAGAADIVRRGVGERAFPAAVVEVGSRDGALWQQAFGTLDYEAGAPVTRVDTVFDLASLTKVIATTSLVMRLVEPRSFGAKSSCPQLDSRVARTRPRTRHDSIASESQFGAHGLASLFPGSHRPAGISARDLLASARIRAGHAVDLQRSRVHPARLHRRRCRRRSVSRDRRRRCFRRSLLPRCFSIHQRICAPRLRQRSSTRGEAVV